MAANGSKKDDPQAPSRDSTEIRQASLLLSALVLTPDDDLEAFRKRRSANGSLDLGHLRRARDILDDLAAAIGSADDAPWARIHQAWQALHPDQEPAPEPAAAEVDQAVVPDDSSDQPLIEDSSPQGPPESGAPARPPLLGESGEESPPHPSPPPDRQTADLPGGEVAPAEAPAERADSGPAGPPAVEPVARPPLAPMAVAPPAPVAPPPLVSASAGVTPTAGPARESSPWASRSEGVDSPSPPGLVPSPSPSPSPPAAEPGVRLPPPVPPPRAAGSALPASPDSPAPDPPGAAEGAAEPADAPGIDVAELNKIRLDSDQAATMEVDDGHPSRTAASSGDGDPARPPRSGVLPFRSAEARPPPPAVSEQERARDPLGQTVDVGTISPFFAASLPFHGKADSPPARPGDEAAQRLPPPRPPPAAAADRPPASEGITQTAVRVGGSAGPAAAADAPSPGDPPPISRSSEPTARLRADGQATPAPDSSRGAAASAEPDRSGPEPKPSGAGGVPLTPPAAGSAPSAADLPGHLAAMGVEQYAALCAECSLHPSWQSSILARYRIESEKQRGTLDAHWRERMAADEELANAWRWHYRRYEQWAKQQK